MRTTVLPLLVSAAALAGGLAPAPAAEACAADGHMGLRWADFPDPLTDGSYPFFYFAGEEAGETTVTVKATGDDCTVPVSQAPSGTYEVRDYDSGDRLATRVADYAPVAGATGKLCGAHGGPHCAQEHSAQVSIIQDLLPEAVAERARALITFSDMRRDIPFDVPLWIIDDDGVSRVAFETAGPTEQSETYWGPSNPLRVAVFRAGPVEDAASFAYSVEGSSDHPATPGQDFKVLSPQPLEFEAGERVALIELELVNDALVEEAEELRITLTDPQPTLLPEDITETTVRIIDNDEDSGAPPSSRFHHPKHRVEYEKGDFRLREFHVFSRDAEAGVARVEVALRRKLNSGACQWFTGKGFARDRCGAKRWVDTEYYPDLRWWYLRLGALKPSEGTNVKSYKAWTRGIDGADNVERRFKRGRNANTFEVDRG